MPPAVANPPANSSSTQNSSRPATNGVKSSLIIWMDGKLLPQAEAMVNVFDHGLLYGDGVFEGIRIYNGRIFENEAHIRRLYQSAKALRLDIPMAPEEWETAIYETAKANNFTDCYIRAVVTRGVGSLGIDPTPCLRPTCFIIADALQLYPKEYYEKGMAVITSSVTRNNGNALSPRVKSLNYLNNILGKFEALDAGVKDAVMLNSEGNVTEATAANLFLIREGVLLTPSLDQGVLEGVTRNTILKLAREMGIPARECVIPRFDLYIADECFLTGTGAEVMPVSQIDRRIVGNGAIGPLTRRLLTAFHKLARGS